MFIQVIDFHTSRMEEGQKHIDEYLATTEGTRKSRRGILTQDREDKTRYVNIVFFDSYEDAMANSELPETQKLSAALMGLGDGVPSFSNLEVISDKEQ